MHVCIYLFIIKSTLDIGYIIDALRFISRILFSRKVRLDDRTGYIETINN